MPDPAAPQYLVTPSLPELPYIVYKSTKSYQDLQPRFIQVAGFIQAYGLIHILRTV